MQRKVTSVSLTDEMKTAIDQSADEDTRQFMDEVRYLISLGLRVRARIKGIEDIAISHISDTIKIEKANENGKLPKSSAF